MDRGSSEQYLGFGCVRPSVRCCPAYTRRMSLSFSPCLQCEGIDHGCILLQGRWWFGSRQKTKDGINAQTASTFFKSLTENDSVDKVFTTLSKASEFSQVPSTSKAPKPSVEQELKELEKKIEELEKGQWADLKELINEKGEGMNGRRRVLILLHAHLLRLKIQDSGLKKGLFIITPHAICDPFLFLY